ncbi:MAG: hypothetical protein JWM26_3313, partial [Betaproteobacteria bacterium]|nr:hypothetical protein [Betaproteobacteria bacterium]
MKPMLARIGWAAVALSGACAFAILALNRGETV